MVPWFARYTSVSGLSAITWHTVPPCFPTSARRTQSGKCFPAFFCTMRWPVMPSGYRSRTSGRSRR